MSIKSNWWKLAGVLLVMTSIFVGLTTKTGPGIARVSPSMVNPQSDFQLNIVGYNTNFVKGAEVKAWLKHDSSLYCATSVTVVDRKTVLASFPAFKGRVDSVDHVALSIVLEDSINGIFLGLEAVRMNFASMADRYAESCSSRPLKLKTSSYTFPFRSMLYESIRNLHFHVPMWFSMMVLLFISFIMSILYLNKGDVKYDAWANSFAIAGLLFGIAGIITGSFWARFTWGTFWTYDPKLNGAAIAVLMYVAYQVLRSSIEEDDKVGRIASVYNILAFPIFIVLIIVLPVLAKFSLHPGSGDSVGFKTYDLNSNLRMVFYPAVLGWILIGVWISTLIKRIKMLEDADDHNHLTE